MDSAHVSGNWSRAEVEAFLVDYRAPMRLAVVTPAGFPAICSLWFTYEEGRILCATTRKAKIVEYIEADPRCAFEIAPNEPPYFGVRGRAIARVSSDGAMPLLERLVVRYLGDRDSRFARWLLGRDVEEVVIALDIEAIASWDYRGRMKR